MAKMVVLYKTPKDAAAFDKHYFEKHIPIAKKLPGLRKYEVSHGPILTRTGMPSDIHLIATLYFDNMEALVAAFNGPEGAASAADRKIFAPNDADVQSFLYEDDDV